MGPGCLFHKQSPLYVVLPYFNFAGFHRRRNLFVQFVNEIAAAEGIRVVISEAEGPTPLPKGLPVWKHMTFKTPSRIWIKENLVNLAADRLPTSWKYMAWIDADITFLNQNWVQETIHELQTADVVQLWRSAVNLGPHGETLKTDTSFAYMFIDSGTPWTPSDKYGFWHPGYAWACTHKAYDAMDGLIDWAILGSGDRHMAMALAGVVEKSCPGNVHNNYMILLCDFQKRMKNFKTSYVDGTIVHHWHGAFANRRYKERWEILTKNQFDPFLDIGMAADGIMSLTEAGRRFETYLDEYFIGRKEDS